MPAVLDPTTAPQMSGYDPTTDPSVKPPPPTGSSQAAPTLSGYDPTSDPSVPAPPKPSGLADAASSGQSPSAIVNYIRARTGTLAPKGEDCGKGIEAMLGMPMGQGGITNLREDPANQVKPDASGRVPDGTGVWFGGDTSSQRHYGITYTPGDGNQYLAEVRWDGPGTPYHYDSTRKVTAVANERDHAGKGIVYFKLPGTGVNAESTPSGGAASPAPSSAAPQISGYDPTTDPSVKPPPPGTGYGVSAGGLASAMMGVAHPGGGAATTNDFLRSDLAAKSPTGQAPFSGGEALGEAVHTNDDWHPLAQFQGFNPGDAHNSPLGHDEQNHGGYDKGNRQTLQATSDFSSDDLSKTVKKGDLYTTVTFNDGSKGTYGPDGSRFNLDVNPHPDLYNARYGRQVWDPKGMAYVPTRGGGVGAALPAAENPGQFGTAEVPQLPRNPVADEWAGHSGLASYADELNLLPDTMKAAINPQSKAEKFAAVPLIGLTKALTQPTAMAAQIGSEFQGPQQSADPNAVPEDGDLLYRAGLKPVVGMGEGLINTARGLFQGDPDAFSDAVALGLFPEMPKELHVTSLADLPRALKAMPEAMRQEYRPQIQAGLEKLQQVAGVAGQTKLGRSVAAAIGTVPSAVAEGLSTRLGGYAMGEEPTAASSTSTADALTKTFLGMPEGTPPEAITQPEAYAKATADRLAEAFQEPTPARSSQRQAQGASSPTGEPALPEGKGEETGSLVAGHEDVATDLPDWRETAVNRWESEAGDLIKSDMNGYHVYPRTGSAPATFQTLHQAQEAVEPVPVTEPTPASSSQRQAQGASSPTGEPALPEGKGEETVESGQAPASVPGATPQAPIESPSSGLKSEGPASPEPRVSDEQFQAALGRFKSTVSGLAGRAFSEEAGHFDPDEFRGAIDDLMTIGRYYYDRATAKGAELFGSWRQAVEGVAGKQMTDPQAQYLFDEVARSHGTPATTAAVIPSEAPAESSARPVETRDEQGEQTPPAAENAEIPAKTKKPKVQYAGSIHPDYLSSDELQDRYRQRAHDLGLDKQIPMDEGDVERQARQLGLTHKALMRMDPGVHPQNVHAAVWMKAVRDADDAAATAEAAAERAYRQRSTPGNKARLDQAKEIADKTFQHRSALAREWGQTGKLVLQKRSDPFAAAKDGDIFRQVTRRTNFRKPPPVEDRVSSPTFGRDAVHYSMEDADRGVAWLKDRLRKATDPSDCID